MRINIEESERGNLTGLHRTTQEYGRKGCDDELKMIRRMEIKNLEQTGKGFL